MGIAGGASEAETYRESTELSEKTACTNVFCNTIAALESREQTDD
jgi:hypothetical protein